MRGCYLYASRVTSALTVSLCSTVQSPHDGHPHEVESRQKHLTRLVCNDFHPIPTEAAPRYIRETFALARGFVPSSSLVTPLVASGRSFSSFHGSAQQFVRDVHDGNIIVFFFKPACGPCAVIRNRIMTAGGKLASGVLGETGEEKAAASSPKQVDDGEGPQDDAAATAARNVVFQSDSPSATSPGTGTSWLNEGGDDDAATRSMSPEDQAMCVQLRSHLSGEDGGAPAGKIRFLAVNTNENDRLTALHDVRSLPTFVAYHNGKIVGRAEGAHEAELLALVKALRQASLATEGRRQTATPHETSS